MTRRRTPGTPPARWPGRWSTRPSPAGRSSLDAWWLPVLLEQRASGFPDLAGSRGSVSLVLSDRLISRLAAAQLPEGSPLRELSVIAEPGNTLRVRVRLARPAFLPPFGIRLVIERQPQLPSSPFFVVRIAEKNLTTLVGPFLRFLEALPPGVQLVGDCLAIDLATLLDRYGLRDALTPLTRLEVTTGAGIVRIDVEAALPPETSRS